MVTSVQCLPEVSSLPIPAKFQEAKSLNCTVYRAVLTVQPDRKH